MLRSAFNYLRYGWTRQKAEAALDTYLATMIKISDYEPLADRDESLLCRTYLKSMARFYPDFTVRGMARVVAAMPNSTRPEAWDCLSTMLDWAQQGSRIDPRGVHDALAAVIPFMERFPDLDRDARYTLAKFEKADPGYRPQPLLT